jgi:hypothetical protein
MQINAKNADRWIDRLAGTGIEGRAKKALAVFRRCQSPQTETAAADLLKMLPDTVLADLRSVASGA